MDNVLSLTLPIKYRLGLNLKIYWTILLISILFLLSFYVFQINSLTKEVYSVRNYEKKLDTLTEENKTLEINFTKISSLTQVENYLLGQNFEKATKVKYIKLLGSQVAAK